MPGARGYGLSGASNGTAGASATITIATSTTKNVTSGGNTGAITISGTNLNLSNNTYAASSSLTLTYSGTLTTTNTVLYPTNSLVKNGTNLGAFSGGVFPLLQGTINSCGNIISPGTYTLSTDLTGISGPCFTVATSSVIIDGGLHTVTAAGGNTSYAVMATSTATGGSGYNVTIQNITFSGFGGGVNASGNAATSGNTNGGAGGSITVATSTMSTITSNGGAPFGTGTGGAGGALNVTNSTTGLLTANGGTPAATFTGLGQTSRGWYGITIAPNGNVYAATYNGDIYMQTGGTGNFVALGQTSRSWLGITAAPNGNVYATDFNNGDIYMQTGGTGNFVALGQTGRAWRSIAAAPNGNVYAGDAGGDMYEQFGGIGNFLALGQGNKSWRGIATSPNGDVYASVQNGDIYKQTGGTGNFVALGQTSRSWGSLAAAPNGDIYADLAGYGGDIYKQTGGVGDFVGLGQTSRAWDSMAVAPNGNVYSGLNYGDIYLLTSTGGGNGGASGSITVNTSTVAGITSIGGQGGGKTTSGTAGNGGSAGTISFTNSTSTAPIVTMPGARGYGLSGASNGTAGASATITISNSSTKNVTSGGSAGSISISGTNLNLSNNTYTANSSLAFTYSGTLTTTNAVLYPTNSIINKGLNMGSFSGGSFPILPGTISTCGTLSYPGTYTLNTDLTGISSTCFTVATSSVIIDGSQHTVTAAGGNTSYAVTATSTGNGTSGYNVTIQNITFSSFGGGVNASGNTSFSLGGNGGNITVSSSTIPGSIISTGGNAGGSSVPYSGGAGGNITIQNSSAVSGSIISTGGVGSSGVSTYSTCGAGGNGGNITVSSSTISNSVTSNGGSGGSSGVWGSHGGVGGLAGMITFSSSNNLTLPPFLISAVGGYGGIGNADTGANGLNGTTTISYIGTLTTTGTTLSVLSHLIVNSTDYGIYVGGVFPLLPGTINSCGTLSYPGTYTLGSNLTGISGTCFTVATSSVIIDGSQHTVTAAGGNTSYAVMATSTAVGGSGYNVTVQNITFSSFGGGVNASGNDDTSTSGNGGNAGNITVATSTIGSILSNGGLGANRQGGGDGTPGGNAGTISVSNSNILASIISNGGTGGFGQYGLSGGVGGNAGTIYITAGSTVTGSVTSTGGTGGSTDNSVFGSYIATSGASGNSGSIYITSSSTVNGAVTANGGVTGDNYKGGKDCFTSSTGGSIYITSSSTVNGAVTANGGAGAKGLNGSHGGNGGGGGSVQVTTSSVVSGIISANGGVGGGSWYSISGNGGNGGSVAFSSPNGITLPGFLISAAGGSGASPLGGSSYGTSGLNGSVSISYVGTLTTTGTTLSALAHLIVNSHDYGSYIGGSFPLLPGTISTCGTLQFPGTYTLNTDLTGISGTCFIVNADNIIIDGAGHTVTSAGGNTSYSVTATSTGNGTSGYNITVQNITFSGFGGGVNASGNSGTSGAGGAAGNVTVASSTLGTIVSSGGNGVFTALGQTSRIWTAMTTNHNGDVYAAEQGGDIYKQAAGTGNFVALGQVARFWYGMTTTPNGDVYASVWGGDIYKQTGGTGDFVALNQGTRNWISMTSTSNGDVYATTWGGDIYKQTGGTGDFIALGQVNRTWAGMATAPNGDVYAAEQGGDIYKQTGGTGNFVGLGQTSRNWWGMTVAPNGDVYATEQGGDIYKQAAGNGNFVALGQTSRVWNGMTAAQNSSLYVVTNGDIYKSTLSSAGTISITNSTTGSITNSGTNGSVSISGTNVNLSNNTYTTNSLNVSYTGTLITANTTLSTLAHLTVNGTDFGAYSGGAWPLFPGEVSTCGNIFYPGTYTLSTDISNVSGTCFNITADNVTINGNGHTITGSNDGGYAVNATGHTNLSINDIHFSNFSHGVNVNASSGSHANGGVVTVASSTIATDITANGDGLGNGGEITIYTNNTDTLDLSNLNLSVLGNEHGTINVNYGGLLLTNNTTLSALNHLFINGTDFGAYSGGAWPLFPGEVYTCGTIPFAGTYSLQNDISASSTCFSIITNNVIIDGLNHTIAGDIIGTGYNFSLVNANVEGRVSSNGGGGETNMSITTAPDAGNGSGYSIGDWNGNYNSSVSYRIYPYTYAPDNTRVLSANPKDVTLSPNTESVSQASDNGQSYADSNGGNYNNQSITYEVYAYKYGSNGIIGTDPIYITVDGTQLSKTDSVGGTTDNGSGADLGYGTYQNQSLNYTVIPYKYSTNGSGLIGSSAGANITITQETQNSHGQYPTFGAGLSWGAADGADGYYIVNNTCSTYIDVGSTNTFEDDGSGCNQSNGWNSGSPSFNYTDSYTYIPNFQAQLSWNAADGADGYYVYNETSGSWVDVGGSTSLTDDGNYFYWYENSWGNPSWNFSYWYSYTPSGLVYSLNWDNVGANGYIVEDLSNNYYVDMGNNTYLYDNGSKFWYNGGDDNGYNWQSGIPSFVSSPYVLNIGGGSVDGGPGGNLTIASSTISGLVSADGGNATYGLASNAGIINISNTKVSGLLSANGGNGMNGGHGGSILAATSTLIGNIFVNGGNGSTNDGGNGGYLSITNTNARGTTASTTLSANGGNTLSCTAKGGNGGSVDVVDSGYDFISTEAGSGPDTNTCPSGSVGGTSGQHHETGGNITPEDRQAAKAAAEAAARAAAAAAEAARLAALAAANAKSSAGSAHLQAPGLQNIYTVLPPVTKLTPIKLTPVPTFGETTSKNSFSLGEGITSFLFAPLPEDITNNLKTSTKLQTYLGSQGFSKAQDLITLNKKPLLLKTSSTSIPGLFTLKAAGLPVKLSDGNFSTNTSIDIPSYLTYNQSSALSQLVKVSPKTQLTINILPTNKGSITAKFNGKDITFNKNSVTLTTPSKPGTYTLTTPSSPLTLIIEVVAPKSASVQQTTSTPISWFTKLLNLFHF